MDGFDNRGTTPNTSDNWIIQVGHLESFSDTNTGAVVTGTMTFHSNDPSGVYGFLGVCTEPAAGGTVISWTGTQFSFVSGAITPVAVSATVGGLTGSYLVGLCTEGESANMVHNGEHGTILLAQTPSAVT